MENINDIVNMYIHNIYNYDSPYTVVEFNTKNEEIKPYVDNDLYAAIQRLRPYPDVIDSMVIDKSNIVIEEVGTGVYKVDFNVYTVSRAKHGDITKSTFYETIEVTLNPIKIKSVRNEAEQHYSTYQDYEDYYRDELILPDVATETAINNIGNENIYYAFKGAPKDNPFTSKNISGLDSYNMVYWLYNTEYTELSYPLEYNNLINSGVFTTVMDGHKYLSNINNLENGDLLFFGKNNNTVGIYIGNSNYVTVKGTFPKDNTTIEEFDLEKDWSKFNGKIMRLKDDYL